MQKFQFATEIKQITSSTRRFRTDEKYSNHRSFLEEQGLEVDKVVFIQEPNLDQMIGYIVDEKGVSILRSLGPDQLDLIAVSAKQAQNPLVTTAIHFFKSLITN